jgi:hypothetical protein
MTCFRTLLTGNKVRVLLHIQNQSQSETINGLQEDIMSVSSFSNNLYSASANGDIYVGVSKML